MGQNTYDTKTTRIILTQEEQMAAAGTKQHEELVKGNIPG